MTILTILPANRLKNSFCQCHGRILYSPYTINGLKPIETINRGELIWSREEFGDKYDYRPVIETKVTR